MRSLPNETPAADNAAAVKSVAAMYAAANIPKANSPAPDNPPGPGIAPGNGAAANSAGPGNALGNAPAVNSTGPVNAPPASENHAAAPDDQSPAAGDATPPANAPRQESPEPIVPLTTADAPSMYTYDPLERLNRFTYRFNTRFDEAIFLPVANGYRRIPSPVRGSVHNFFSNLSEVDSVANYILQARLGAGVRSLGRFVINSTLGIGGLFDVATKLNLANPPTGFSATLSTWGMHPGPYLVIPLLGPSTLRDGVGYLGDYGISYGVNLADLYRGYQSYALGTVNAIDQRANTNFRYYATGSPFEYETLRFLYVRKRLIEDAALHRHRKIDQRDSNVPAGR